MKSVNLSQAWAHLGTAIADVHGAVDRSRWSAEIREAYAGRVSIELATGGASIRVSLTIAEARALAAAGEVEATP